MHTLARADSSLMLRLKQEIDGSFGKRFKVFFSLANSLKISNDEATVIRSAVELPGIDNDFETLFAIVFQNLLGPKNNHRKDAVTNKTYREVGN